MAMLALSVVCQTIYEMFIYGFDKLHKGTVIANKIKKDS